ncbi:MAG: response regulator [Crocosphaera sp.]|nr:response regulator [Crocosphaera sp.]
MPKNIPKDTQSLYSILSEGKYSGCIKISNPIHQWISWEVYCNHNYIYYATSSIGQQERLKCLWKYFLPNFSPPSSFFTVGDYEIFTNWWQENNLHLPLLQRLISNLTQEALTHALSIDSPLIEFLPNQQLLSPVTFFSSQKMAESAYLRSKKWKQYSYQNISPFHRLYLNSDKTHQFYQLWKSNHSSYSEKRPRISFWLSNLSEKYCLYELAADRGILPLKFMKDFQYLFKENIIEFLDFTDVNLNRSKETISNPKKVKESFSNDSPIIACIDDSRTVQKHIKKTLELSGYQTLNLTDPTLCLTTLARYHPSLILMDINMPQINGYELCKILKKSRKLSEIPIVMLTGRDGLIDRIRAKRFGVEYYLTKPCNPKELIEVVNNLTSVKSINISDNSSVNSG